MYKFSGALHIGVALFAAVSSSSSMQLNNYSLGSSASNNTQSANYFVEGSAGELQGVGTVSGTYTTGSGSTQAQQASVPPAPTLSNAAGTYYNRLLVTIATGGNAADTTYSLAISTDNFATTNYVQIDGSIAATPVYRTYVQWGSTSGTTIVGLHANTTYKVKANALQGKFTATAYGPAASAATAIPTLSFSLAPNTLTLSSLTPGTVVSSSTAALVYSTNGATGGSVYMSGQNGGLKSTKNNFTLSSVTGDLGSLSQGFGVQSITPTQTSGGPFAAQAPFNVTSSSVGAVTTSFQPIYTSTAAVTGATGGVILKAKAAATTPAGNDYAEVLTFVAAASY